MAQVPIGIQTTAFPMPAVLVGSLVHGKANFLTVAWCTRVNHEPPIVAVAIRRNRHTWIGVEEHGTFSVCVPGSDNVALLDYCGLVSGKDVDKSTLAPVFFGSLATAPLLEPFPVNLACRVVERVSLPTHDLFCGEVVEAFATESILDDSGKIDGTAFDPLSFLGTTRMYVTPGREVGKAYAVGHTFKPI